VVPTLTLSNITIKKLVDKNLNDYCPIIDNSQEILLTSVFPKLCKLVGQIYRKVVSFWTSESGFVIWGKLLAKFIS